MSRPEQPLRISSFPQAVAHIDGDAFFTSVEQSVHPALKGRPVVTGKERGIIACASYEAKALGIRRGVGLWEAQKICKDLVVLPSDYETYSIYSKRMFDIFRRYTPMVEEHSIDEGFCDLSGLRRLHRGPYEDIARRIQADVQAELDITVSVGLSLSKSLAKLASSFRKPNGFTAVAGYHLHLFLPRIALSDVWGFGPNTVHLLQKEGLKTAYDFVLRPEKWAEKRLGKIGKEIWNELRGNSVYPVNTEEKSSYATLSKCKTFAAPSDDRDFVKAKLIRNVESACIKLRRHRLRAREISVGLRHQDYRQDALSARLNRGTSAVHELQPIAQKLFDSLYRAGKMYRATMVVLSKLEADHEQQYELFDDVLRIEAMARASRAIDGVNARFGKHALALGSALHLGQEKKTDRAEDPWRRVTLLEGETERCRLHIPMLDIRV